MNPKIWLISGAILGGLAVALGAIGAHLLQDKQMESSWYGLTDVDYSAEIQAKSGKYMKAREMYETAVRYHMYHALALLAVGLWGVVRPSMLVHVAGLCFLLGTVLFSGSLYAYYFMPNLTWLVIFTPLGGFLLIIGWGCLFTAGRKLTLSENEP